METFAHTAQTLTNENMFSLASWERPRSKEELVSFLDSREAACDVEDFDF